MSFISRQIQERVRDNANMEGKDGAYLQNDVPQRTEEKKETPPFDLTIRWGWTESVISRRTAKMIINNKPIQDLRKWVQDVFFPEVLPFLITHSALNFSKMFHILKMEKSELWNLQSLFVQGRFPIRWAPLSVIFRVPF